MRRSRCTPVVIAMLLSAALLLLSSIPAMALQVGDKAPDFSLPATTAEKISLADFAGKKSVVVFFYLYAFSGL
jgi:cytochrome oxidase Cu insertion factor (SCO1/SenC/PrrC family)